MLLFMLFICQMRGVAESRRSSKFGFYEFFEDYYTQLFENDANLNAGFNIEKFRQHQLDLHNYYRHKHGVPLMTLDSTLTKQAQAYAEKLALNEEGLIHCFDVPGCDYDGAAENLASARGYTGVEANATVMWYREIWDYNFCTIGRSDRHRPGHERKAIGHFTQVVWETSTLLGIGYSRTSDRHMVYIVARYKPHGNVIGQYNRYVRRPAYFLDMFQDNCYEDYGMVPVQDYMILARGMLRDLRNNEPEGIDGGLSDWMGPGRCTRTCGGGVRLMTKSCTNPKPSLNGRDCEGDTKKLVPEWCNTHACSGKLSHRDLQCAARREAADAYNFGGIRDCRLHCRISRTHFLLVGYVDDGTHCKRGSGACINGICYNMPDYVVGTEPPMILNLTEVAHITKRHPKTTNSATLATTQSEIVTSEPSNPPARELVTGVFNSVMKKRFGRLFTIPSGATDVVIQNSKPRNSRIFVRFQKGDSKPTPYCKKYGREMMPFTEQIGRGSVYIMPVVVIEGPIKPHFKVIVYIQRRRRHVALVSWHYWTGK